MSAAGNPDKLAVGAPKAQAASADEGNSAVAIGRLLQRNTVNRPRRIDATHDSVEWLIALRRMRGAIVIAAGLPQPFEELRT